MKRLILIASLILLLPVSSCAVGKAPAKSLVPDISLEAGWQSPPQAARLWAYWWWLNGNVDAAAITRDLEEMAAKGFGGAILCDAGVLLRCRRG